MLDTITLLKEMRGRLGMYVGSTSLTKLATFLRGYDYAAERLGVRKTDPFLAGFRDWVHQRFQDSSRSWEDAILARSANEADAVKRFWELLDEFVKENPPQGSAPGLPLAGVAPNCKPLQAT
jgi:hypothetical protein